MGIVASLPQINSMQIKFFIISYTFLLVACSQTEERKEINWDDRLSHKVDPFVVEHFELTTTPDSSIVLYFNREINVKEDAFIYIHTLIGNDHCGANPLIPIQTKNKKFILKLPIPDSLSHRNKANDGLTNEGRMMNLLRAYWETPDQIDQIDFNSTMSPDLPIFRFMNGKLDTWNQDFLLFNNYKTRNQKSRDHNHPWRKIFLKNYQGSFDENHLKQGNWTWFYGNGQILANGKFKNDSLIENLLIYDYQGNCIDTVFCNYTIK